MEEATPMSAKTVLAAISLLFVLIVPLASAQAACEVDGSDLDKTWTLYLSTVVGGTQHAQQCPNVKGVDGVFRPGRCRTIRFSVSEMAVDRRCQVTGAWTVTLSDGTQRGCALTATLTKDHQLIRGFLTCEPSPVWELEMLVR
jgi:hypothetical protein